MRAVKRLFSATKNSWRGIVDGVTTEAAVREETVVLAVAIPVGFFIAPNPPWYVAMIGVLLVVMAIEFLNTAIEKLSDHVTPHHHDAIGRVKDMASAAVGLSLLLAAIVWLVAIAERFGLI